MKKLKNQKGASAIIIIIVVLGILFILAATSDSDNTSTSTSSGTIDLAQNTTKQNVYGLGDTFTFDELQITIGESYSFVSVSNQFSEYNGYSVIKLPVKVTNLSSEKNNLNMFYYDFFGSKGVELDSVSAYFDDEVGYAGELKSGASYNKYFYILYDGSGTYSIDFDNYSEEVSVEFEVN